LVIANVIALSFVVLSASKLYQPILLEIMIIGLDFIVIFILSARYVLKTIPDSFWTRFSAIVLVIFSIYTALTLAVGAPLGMMLGFGAISVPPNSSFTQTEVRILTLYTYGLSSLISGLVTLSIAYLLQKHLIHQLFRAYKFLKYDSFIESNAIIRNSSTITYILWLMLLPFPIQQSLSPGGGFTFVSTIYYLPTVVAAFVVWGLSKTYVAGIKKDRIFRIYDVVRSALFWFILIQWVSIIVYSFSSSGDFVTNALKLANGFRKLGILLGTSLFYFAPSAITTAYFYKHALEERASKNIIAHLTSDEKLIRKELQITAE
jgi:hypothetical protein